LLRGSPPPEDKGLPSPKIHHIGIAVESIDEALSLYEDALGVMPTLRTEVPGEGVSVAILTLSDSRIELLEAAGANSPITKFLTRRGPGLHHIAVRVDDLEASVARLRDSGRRLVTDEIRRGAEGYRYVFIHPSSAGGVLLELIEEP
jgi:methylmalonyl-CoA epimerase